MFSLQNVGIINENSLFIYYESGRSLKRGSLSNVNFMGDCDGATQYACQRSFPVTAFDLVTMVSLRDLQPL